MRYLFEIQGIVQRHKGRGRELGFPTANINAPADVPNATYVGLTLYNGKEYPSVIFVGVAETFGDKKRFAEAYLLDFNEDIYEKSVTMKGIKKLRENRKFESKEVLLEQMKKDENKAKEFFGK